MNKKIFKVLFIFMLFMPFFVYATTPTLDGPTIAQDIVNCKELLGPNLIKIISFIFSTLRVGASIIAIVNAMIILLPAVIAKDADALKKSEKKLITLAIVLVLIMLLPTLIIATGNLFGYDLSCFA